jgi:NAD(P)-dependent dehydrogenase (short-subunit alcohol dehydrogenase family)
MGLLTGKTALITGSGSGIGRAACLVFAREGARIVAADLSAEAAAHTVALVQAAGGHAVSVVGDVSSEADVVQMMETVVDLFGHLDCAFNNAGITGDPIGQGGRKLADWDRAGFETIIAVNLTSVWSCMKHEIRAMLAHGGGGAIVNTASIAGLAGLAYASGYVAAKHGVVGLTKSAALDYAKDGIRTNAVCPGFIETRMTQEVMERGGERMLRATPMGRLGKPEEIAELAAWLCSDRASYVNGATYAADGGYLAV